MKIIAIATVLAMSLSLSAASAETAPMPFNPAKIRAGIQQAVGKAFEKIDANRDGRITQAEVAAFTKAHELSDGRPMNGPAWRKSDTNGDGVVSRSEFMTTVMGEYDSVATGSRGR